MITEHVMAPGDFSVQLRDDTPWTVLDAIDIDSYGLGHVCVLPAWFPPTAMSSTGMLANAIFTGVARSFDDLRAISGPGLAMWLGDEDGKGDILSTAVTKTTAATYGTWMGSLCPSSLHPGTFTEPGAGTLNWSVQYASRRDSVQYVNDYYGCEWRIDYAGSLHGGPAGSLYGTVATGIVTPWADGDDTSIRGITGRISKHEDLEDYTTKVYVKDDAAAVSSSSSATSYDDLLGGDVVMERYIDGSSGDPTVKSGTGTSVAAGQLGRFDSVRRHYTVSTPVYSISTMGTLGGNIYLFDPDNGVYNLGTQVRYRGEVMYPKMQRIYGWSWPVREGMGVYYRQPSGTIVDLTPYVEWETGDATISVGAPLRSLSKAMQRRGIRR